MVTAAPLVINLPWPPKYLWPNQRGRSYRAQDAAKAAYREEVYYIARAAKDEANWETPERVRVSIRASRRGPGPAPDSDGLIAALKSARDACTSVGIWVDDDPAHWELGTVESLKGDRTEVVITVEEKL